MLHRDLKHLRAAAPTQGSNAIRAAGLSPHPALEPITSSRASTCTTATTQPRTRTCHPLPCRAYGNAVGGFLLDMLSHPAWLLTLAYIMCVIQLLVGEQVVEFVMFSSWEARFVRRFHRFKWLGREVTDAEGRTIRVPSRWTMLLIRCGTWKHARCRMRC